MKTEKSPYYIDYVLAIQERSFIFAYNQNLNAEIRKIQNVVKANEHTIQFLNQKINKLKVAHDDFVKQPKNPIKCTKSAISRPKIGKGPQKQEQLKIKPLKARQ